MYICSNMQSDLGEDYSVNFFAAASISTAAMQLPKNPVDIAKSIRNEVIAWNFAYKSSGVRGSSGEWKQPLKNNFAFFIRFQNVTAGSWKQHLQEAANRTIEEMCPHWDSDHKQRAMSESIRKQALTNRCPTSKWLMEKAYAWLKWLSQKPEHPEWYPHAIAVAYELFLDGTGVKFSSLLTYLDDKQHTGIRKMLQAHNSNVGSASTSSTVHHNGDSGCLCMYILQRRYNTNLLILGFVTKSSFNNTAIFRLKKHKLR